jgi:hypothetical protein
MEFAAIPDPHPTVSGALWAYLLDTEQWVRLDDGDLPHRMQAAGVYGAGRGEILAFGGQSEPYESDPHDAQTESFAIPVELPATFHWSNGERGEDDAAGRSGTLQLPVGATSIQDVRLFDSSTGKAVGHSNSVHRLGRSRWRVTFGPASEDELHAKSIDRLVISGLMAGQTRAFLSRVPARKQTEGIVATDDLLDDPVEGTKLQVVCRLDAEDWLLVVRGTQKPPESIVIADVRGRIWARLSDLAAQSGSGIVYKWRVNGVAPPRGKYFVRVSADGQVSTAKLFVR